MSGTKSEMKKKLKQLKKSNSKVATVGGSHISAKNAHLKTVKLICGKYGIIAKKK